MNQRPQHFRLDYGANLGKGLVFAGLGQHPGSTHFHDSFARKNHGTLTNMDPPTDWVWSAELGRWSNAFADLQYIDLPDSTIGALSAFSMSIWLKKTTTVTTSTFMVGKTNLSAADYDWGLYQHQATQKFYFFTDTSDGTDYILEDTASANGWCNIVATYDGANLRLYARGKEAATPVAQTGTLDSSLNLTIGGGWDGCYWGEMGGGDLADVMFWNRVLSAAEASRLADPSNVMLDGLILAPRRRVFKSTAAAPPGVDALFAAIQPQNELPNRPLLEAVPYS